MNMHRVLMEKIISLLLIAYAISLILGETLRKHIFLEGSRKQQIYSGPFIFLNLKPDLSPPILSLARSTFSQVDCPVRTHV